jgi:hypothetical protein
METRRFPVPLAAPGLRHLSVFSGAGSRSCEPARFHMDAAFISPAERLFFFAMRNDYQEVCTAVKHIYCEVRLHDKTCVLHILSYMDRTGGQACFLIVLPVDLIKIGAIFYPLTGEKYFHFFGY